MAWSKLKTIIILILLLLNLFLAGLIAAGQLRAVRAQSDALDSTLEALALSNIAVEDGALPGPMELPSLTVTRDGALEEKAVRLLLGENVISTHSGGMSIHSSVEGNLSFYGGGAVSAALSLPWNDYPSPADHAAALLGELGVEVWSLSEEGNTVSAVPMVGGAPLFDGVLTFTYDQTSLLALEGRFSGLASPGEGEDAVSVPTALVSLLDYILSTGTVCRSIRSMTAGYALAAVQGEEAVLSPCWLVVTDTASYYIDGASGAVSRAA